jgi:hypothetical protein
VATSSTWSSLTGASRFVGCSKRRPPPSRSAAFPEEEPRTPRTGVRATRSDSRVAPTSDSMSATVEKPGRAMVRMRGQRCCACSWGAYINDNVDATRRWQPSWIPAFAGKTPLPPPRIPCNSWQAGAILYLANAHSGRKPTFLLGHTGSGPPQHGFATVGARTRDGLDD